MRDPGKSTLDCQIKYGLEVDEMEFPDDFPGVCDIVNSGVVDYAAPVPVKFLVTPNVATEGTDLLLNGFVRITDLGTGIKTAKLSLHTGIGEFSQRIGFWFKDLVPADPRSFLWAGVKYDAELGAKVIFGPYTPGTNHYTLFSILFGTSHNESFVLSATAQAYEENPSMGCFVLLPSSGLDGLLVYVKAERKEI